MQRAIELATGLVERITRLREAVLRNEDRPAADAIGIQLNAMKQDVEDIAKELSVVAPAAPEVREHTPRTRK